MWESDGTVGQPKFYVKTEDRYRYEWIIHQFVLGILRKVITQNNLSVTYFFAMKKKCEKQRKILAEYVIFFHPKISQCSVGIIHDKTNQNYGVACALIKANIPFKSLYLKSINNNKRIKCWSIKRNCNWKPSFVSKMCDVTIKPFLFFSSFLLLWVVIIAVYKRVPKQIENNQLSNSNENLPAKYVVHY